MGETCDFILRGGILQLSGLGATPSCYSARGRVGQGRVELGRVGTGAWVAAIGSVVGPTLLIHPLLLF